MSKIEPALVVVNNLRTLADSIEVLVKALNIENSNEPTETAAQAQAQTEQITLEQVRAVLAEKSQNGKQLEVKALITALGVNKLTDLDLSKYEELLKKAGEI